MEGQIDKRPDRQMDRRLIDGQTMHSDKNKSKEIRNGLAVGSDMGVNFGDILEHSDALLMDS